MIKSLSILFYIRKDKEHSNGEVPIYCRITIEGQRSVFALRRTVSSDKWDSIKQNVKGNSEESKNINAYITLITNRIYEITYRMEESKELITAQSVKEYLIGSTPKRVKSIFRIFEDHNNKIKSLIGSGYSARTLERFQTTLKHLRDFVKWKYNKSDFNLHEVNLEFITELDYFLRSQKHIANNTTVKYVTNFKKIIKIAIANSWITSNPFTSYTMKIKKTNRGFLSSTEIEAIYNKRFEIKRLEQIRDIFIFQCYTGLAYADASKITRENLLQDNNGVMWLRTRRVKTEEAVNLPLLPRAIQILEKYKDNADNNPDGHLLPFPTNQKMNAYLKEIGELCGVEKSLSSHLARHTFATTVTLNNGVSLETVSKMLGHTNIMTTKIYARMLDTRVLDEMQKLQGRMLDQKNKERD